jgi:ribosomal protein L11 methyltransferase
MELHVAELNRLEIIASPEDTDIITAILALAVNHGWEEEDLPSGEVLFRVHSHNPQFCLELETELKSRLPGLELSLDMVPELNWVETWKEFFTPVEAGSRFLVLAPWMEAERATTTRIPIVIEPKTAFGTGHHATTALCLTALDNLYDQGRIRAGQRFFDLGTGSGILGIAAAKLGLVGQGVDVDILAVENALENRDINEVAPAALAVERGGLGAAENGPYDLVLANILAEPLMQMAPDLMNQVKRPGGCLVLSGILATQGEQVREAYAALGEPEVARQTEWISLVWKL